MIRGRASKLELSIRKRLGRVLHWLGAEDNSNLNSHNLEAFFEDKSVALIGNARALSRMKYGSYIDQHEVVVRLNTAPMPSPESHGTRTDVVATSVVLSKSHFHELNARMIWWMTPKPMALPSWMTRFSGYYRYPEIEHTNLMNELGTRPTTGLMAIEILRSLPCKSIDLFGFDFFSSFSLSNEKKAAPSTHDFSKERSYVHDLVGRDRRFRLISS